MGSSLLNWLVTESGRKFMGGVPALTFCGIAGAHVAPHSLFIDRFRDFLQMYRYGEAIPVSDAVMQRAKEVIEECNRPEINSAPVQFFTSAVLDFVRAGSTKVRGGPMIGIPCTFQYGKPEEIEKDLLLVDRQKFNFNSELGQQMLDSLILSERAQKYAIARELYSCTTHYIYIQSLIATTSCLLTYCMASFINTRFNFLKLPRPARIAMYMLTGSIGLTYYLMLRDGLSLYYDREADLAACSLGKEYVLGGVEFYEKLLARNRALREALGPRGKSQYTMFGNEEVYLRTKNLPVTSRLDIVKDTLKEMENKDDSGDL